jgi:hypothetical protein
MLNRVSLVLLPSLFFLAVVRPLAPQSAGHQPQPSAPIPMPVDRAAASYEIYAALLPLGETAGPGWPHDLWLVQNTTVSTIPSAEPCARNPTSDAASPLYMDPRASLKPTEDGREDFEQVLQDFDEHCHDRVILDPGAWKTKVPVRLLNEQEQSEFQRWRSGAPDPVLARKYKGAPALYGFSEVYFNAHSTVALVYATHWCGGLCGEGMWVALARKDGHWKRLNWTSSSWIS